MVLVMQPVIEGFLRSAIGSALGEDDDDWLEKAVKASGSSVVSFNLGLLVVVRELAYLTTDYGYRGPSGLRKITDFGRAYNATVHAIENGEVSEADVKAWVSFGGTMAPTRSRRSAARSPAPTRSTTTETDNPLRSSQGTPTRVMVHESEACDKVQALRGFCHVVQNITRRAGPYVGTGLVSAYLRVQVFHQKT
ncbi:MAG: hypothetical protein ACLS29_09375 [Prevotellamassilia sp.]